MNKYELKRAVQRDSLNRHFFDRETMRFFGDTMVNYGVRAEPVSVITNTGESVDCWELYRRRPVKHGIQTSAFFKVSDFRRVFPAKEPI